MKYQIETIAQCHEAILALSKDHAEEAGYLNLTANVNQEQFHAIEKIGSLRIFTLRTDADRLVGYNIFILSDSELYGIPVATQSALYVMPEYRGRPAISLIMFADQYLVTSGSRAIIRSHSQRNPISRLYERLGYSQTEVVFCKHFPIDD